MKELTGLAREKTGCVGISAEPIESNLYEWEVRLFGFDPKSTVRYVVFLTIQVN
jgi:hypothetical protein